MRKVDQIRFNRRVHHLRGGNIFVILPLLQKAAKDVGNDVLYKDGDVIIYFTGYGEAFVQDDEGNYIPFPAEK